MCIHLCSYSAHRYIRGDAKHFITSETVSHIILTIDMFKSYLCFMNEETEAHLRLYTG